MTLPSGPVPSFGRTIGLQSGPALQKLADLIASIQVGIVAQADGTKANATQLNAAICEITSVVGANDSVLLPQGYAGLQVLVINNGGNIVDVFGKGTDVVNDQVTATGISQADNTAVIYVCVKVSAAGVGQWYTLVGAAFLS